MGVGATISYLIKEVKDWPLIEYSISKPVEVKPMPDPEFLTIITIANINSNKMIEEVKFKVILDYNLGITLRKAIPKFLPPFHASDALSSSDSVSYDLPIQNFQPNAVFKINLTTSGPVIPQFSCTSNKCINLAYRSLKTMLFRNQITIIIVLTLIWISFIFGYLFIIANLKQLKDEC